MVVLCLSKVKGMAIKMEKKEHIAWRAAQFLKDGEFVNLGIGIPTLCANFVPEGVSVILHSENGIVGMGPRPDKEHEDNHIVDAGSNLSSILPGGFCCDLCTSFALMRGGHLDRSILGALQVDRHGSFASWKIPGKMTYGVGGAMDLAAGVRWLAVAMDHCTKDGSPKILDECTYPITAKNCLDYIITDLCVLRCEDDALVLEELAPGVALETVLSKTAAKIVVPDRFED